MSKAVLTTLIGIVLVFLPFLGLPSVVKTSIAVLAGAIIIVLGLLMRVERLWLLRALRGGHKTDTYAENNANVENATQAK